MLDEIAEAPFVAAGAVENPPRIKQHLDAEAAEILLILCGGKIMPDSPAVVLDYDGRYWSLERKTYSILKDGDPRGVEWRRLHVPPLPSGPDNAG